MTEARPHLHHPKYGKVTQGSVFCCAKAHRYSGCEVFGLTITARCDVAQSKYPVLNYLPVVCLKDWLLRDGLDILVEQEHNEQMGTLKSMLRQEEVSESILISVPLEKVAETHFPLEGVPAKQKKAGEKFRAHIELMNQFKAVVDEAKSENCFDWFAKCRDKKIKDLVQRLSRHNVLGHYLLERLYLDEHVASGYVCLLREVTTLERVVAQQIGKGLDRPTYEDLIAESGRSGGLNISDGELAAPITEIGSPTIEHILQSFSNLFGRIGVADPSEQVINKLFELCTEKTRGR